MQTHIALPLRHCSAPTRPDSTRNCNPLQANSTNAPTGPVLANVTTFCNVTDPLSRVNVTLPLTGPGWSLAAGSNYTLTYRLQGINVTYCRSHTAENIPIGATEYANGTIRCECTCMHCGGRKHEQP